MSYGSWLAPGPDAQQVCSSSALQNPSWSCPFGSLSLHLSSVSALCLEQRWMHPRTHMHCVILNKRARTPTQMFGAWGPVRHSGGTPGSHAGTEAKKARAVHSQLQLTGRQVTLHVCLELLPQTSTQGTSFKSVLEKCFLLKDIPRVSFHHGHKQLDFRDLFSSWMSFAFSSMTFYFQIYFLNYLIVLTVFFIHHLNISFYGEKQV